MTNKKIIAIKQESPILFVYWHLTDLCNFSCNYCPPFLNKGWYATNKFNGFPTDQEIFMLLKNLETLSIDRSLYIVLSGGEPTIHPLFIDILEKNKKFSSVGLITNASRPLSWWKKIKNLPDRITISLHPEYTDIKKINYLSDFLFENNVKFVYHLSSDPNNWDKVENLFYNINDKYKSHILFKILTDLNENQNRNTFEYDQNQKKFISTKQIFDVDLFEDFEMKTEIIFSDGSKQILNAQEIILNENNKFKDWFCSAGINGIKINVDGNVYAGICSIENLGRIDNFKLKTKFVTCNRSNCACPGDIRLEKFNQNYETK